MKLFFWYVGAMNLLLITAALAGFRFKKKSEWKRILPVLAMLLYNFGTMLLLSGGDFRLFYYAFPITPVLLLLVLREELKTPAADTEEVPSDPKELSDEAFVEAPQVDQAAES